SVFFVEKVAEPLFRVFCAATRHPLTPHPQGVRRIRKGCAASVRRQSRRRLRSEKYFLRRTRRRRKWFHFLSRLRKKLGETFKGKLKQSDEVTSCEI
ncbi:MAG: hypothetical protein IJA73_04290, partial [Oscillospiraceae bacterium]|nr:hypothetical protein [Oscillospiraceae bacterium]